MLTRRRWASRTMALHLWTGQHLGVGVEPEVCRYGGRRLVAGTLFQAHPHWCRARWHPQNICYRAVARRRNVYNSRMYTIHVYNSRMHRDDEPRLDGKYFADVISLDANADGVFEALHDWANDAGLAALLNGCTHQWPNCKFFPVSSALSFGLLSFLCVLRSWKVPWGAVLREPFRHQLKDK